MNLAVDRESGRIYTGDVLESVDSEHPIGFVREVKEDTVIVHIDGIGEVSKEKESLKRSPKCSECSSRMLYHDREERRFCPFCDSW